MEKAYTKEELVALSEATLKVYRKKRNRPLLVNVFLLVCIVGIGIAFKYLAIRYDDYRTAFSVLFWIAVIAGCTILIIGGIVFYLSNGALRAFEKGYKDYKSGKFTKKRYYDEFLVPAWKLVKTDYNEISGSAGVKENRPF